MPSEKGHNGTKGWTPTVPAKRPDNIISSDYARMSNVFTPSYERECRPCMNQLIANEYQRIWWEERDTWAKNHPEKSNKAKKFQPIKHEGSSHKVAIKSSSKNLATKGKAKKEEVALKKRDKNSNSQKKAAE